MTIYIVLLLIVSTAILVDHSNVGIKIREKRSDLLLRVLFLLIYLIFALRASSVGRDIPGYENVYKWTGYYNWDDYSYVYFEFGYILLMKVCSALGMNFQWFLAVVTAITLYPIYLFIKRYSSDKCLSCLIYVSYMLFEFDLTGIRQALAMSISLLAFMCLMERKKGYLIKYLLLIWIASEFHKSAWVCILILPLLYLNDLYVYTVVIAAGTTVSLLLRNVLFRYIKDFFDKETFRLGVGLHFGGNFFFIMVLAAFFLVSLNTQRNRLNILAENSEQQLSQNMLLYKLFLLGILLSVFFGNETSARSFMYYIQAIILLVPNVASGLTQKSVILYKTAFVIFLIWFFFANTLIPNNFDIVPYRFFWQ